MDGRLAGDGKAGALSGPSVRVRTAHSLTQHSPRSTVAGLVSASGAPSWASSFYFFFGSRGAPVYAVLVPVRARERDCYQYQTLVVLEFLFLTFVAPIPCLWCGETAPENSFPVYLC